MPRDGAFMKSQRVTDIKKEIAKNLSKGPVDAEQMLDWVEINQGLTRTKAREYVELAVRGQGWIITDGKIKSEL